MIYWKQFKSLLTHKWYVLKAGLFVGGIPLWRLIIHDWSKFMPVEFINYSHFKYGVKDKKQWAKAWLHHLHHNPHHPEHWILSWRGDPKYYDDLAEPIAEFVSVQPMSETYVREMVADMLATSKEVTGNWDIAVWLNKNGSSMRLHNEAITRLDAVMHEIDYHITDNCLWSYIAGRNFRQWVKDKYRDWNDYTLEEKEQHRENWLK